MVLGKCSQFVPYFIRKYRTGEKRKINSVAALRRAEGKFIDLFVAQTHNVDMTIHSEIDCNGNLLEGYLYVATPISD